MSDKLTPMQALAVENTGGNLLVSAAAGSGKTKVLVDRLMRSILDPVNPADMDDFLMITYTKAAAAELRGKIAAKLTEHLSLQPENRHLQRQMQRLYLAKISTVHAFCADILREYAYQLDIPADFRVADENECAQLRETVMTRMLDSAYETAESDPDFRAFVDAQGLGRDDRLVPQILLRVYDSAQCHLDPQAWLDSCVAHTDTSGSYDVSQTQWGRYLMENLKQYLKLQITAIQNCIRAAQAGADMEKPAALLMDTLAQLERLHACESWDGILSCKNIDFGRLSFSKKTDPEIAEQIKAVRKACKDGLEKKLKAFTDPSYRMLADMENTVASVRGIVALVRRFDREFSRAKQARRILDFGDLEHQMLDLLYGKSRSGITNVARELSQRFREIMVDEYQDSNAVQDAIFSALTAQKQNCFMVGDVKQSIYQFRLADPTIFLKKYSSYVPAEKAKAGEGRKVLLSANFRSGGDVLKGVNDVFRLCMSETVGGLAYGDEEALQEGIPHEPLGEPEVELWAVDVQDSTYPEEAQVVAERIRELLDGEHYVRGKEGLRRIRPEDIAILLRSPGSVGGYYRSALAAQGIRCVSGGGDNLLEAPEVATLRAILQTVSNPRQDIPLIAALASPVFGFTADDLAAFRSQKRYGTVYDALTRWENEKARNFFETLQDLRRQARMGSITQLIEAIFLLTRMDSIYAAMPDGKTKTDNLQSFYSYCADYEASGRRDLEQFLEHLEAISEKGLIQQGEQTSAGAVTLMSIHKSKGLEFPVVFVSGLSKSFNRESSRAHILCDQKLGLGLSVVDTENRLRYPTAAKRAIAAKILSDSLSEEMRVLYVALTRARDRLIMTYASQTLEKDLKDLVCRMDLSPTELLTQDVVCPGEWVLMTALRRTEAGNLFALGGKPGKTELGDPAWRIDVVQSPAESSEDLVSEEPVSKLDSDAVGLLAKGLSFRYDHLAATRAPSKQTATQRKGRLKDSEVAENTESHHGVYHTFRKPDFSDPQLSATEIGNVTHFVMQHLDFGKCHCEESVGEEIHRLQEEGRISAQQAGIVDCHGIAAFFQTDVGKRFMDGEQVLREFKFSILDDGEYYDGALKAEKILLQGVVDCALIEEDGITVVDFKTDRVSGQTLQERADHYRPQVEAYAHALSRIFEKPVKQALLYFFEAEAFVCVQ